MAIILILFPAKSMRTTIDGGRMNFKFLLTVMEEEPGNIFKSASFGHYARASRPRFNPNCLYFRDMPPLCRLADGAATFINFDFFWRKLGILYFNGPAASSTIKPPAGNLDSSLIIIPAEASSARVTNDRKREVDWLSLPVLPLLKIMDMLDVFDNRRLTAVCKDWWSVSVRYPKNIYSVGDGEPWICLVKYGIKSHLREFISVSKNRKFQVRMPEFANSQILSSKGGWLLLQTGGLNKIEFTCWCLVNLFTRDKIELPKIEGYHAKCRGLFKLGGDGCPDRVYLIIPEVRCQARIHTARPGDKEWTSHNYTGLDRKTFLSHFSYVAIGDMVYCKGWQSGTSVFNLANNSVKVLPPISPTGFITEHEGELIYVDRPETGSIKSMVVHKYHDASSSWEKLKHNPVMGTSWYLSKGLSAAISAKGSGGTNIYELLPKVTRSGPRLECSYFYISVTDVLLGIRTGRRIPFPCHSFMFWVAIG